MIYSIKGVYKGKSGEFLYIENNSITWEVVVPSYSGLPAIGQDIVIYTYLYHREDTMQLYGFFDIQSRELFLQLIKVQGIGPKQAVKILSSANSESLSRFILDNDISNLSSIPGIGKKTAQKILLTLKDKLVTTTEKLSDNVEHEDLINALIDMGFERDKIKKVLPEVEKQLSDKLPKEEKEKEMLRLAIIALSR